MGAGQREAISRRVDVTRGDVADVIFDVADSGVGRPPAPNPIAAGGTARIEGLVSDIDSPGAAALARTRVTVTNGATGAIRRVQTDPLGTFQIGRLPAGRFAPSQRQFAPVNHVLEVELLGDVEATQPCLELHVLVLDGDSEASRKRKDNYQL